MVRLLNSTLQVPRLHFTEFKIRPKALTWPLFQKTWELRFGDEPFVFGGRTCRKIDCFFGEEELFFLFRIILQVEALKTFTSFQKPIVFKALWQDVHSALADWPWAPGPMVNTQQQEDLSQSKPCQPPTDLSCLQPLRPFFFVVGTTPEVFVFNMKTHIFHERGVSNSFFQGSTCLWFFHLKNTQQKHHAVGHVKIQGQDRNNIWIYGNKSWHIKSCFSTINKLATQRLRAQSWASRWSDPNQRPASSDDPSLKWSGNFSCDLEFCVWKTRHQWKPSQRLIPEKSELYNSGKIDPNHLSSKPREQNSLGQGSPKFSWKKTTNPTSSNKTHIWTKKKTQRSINLFVKPAKGQANPCEDVHHGAFLPFHLVNLKVSVCLDIMLIYAILDNDGYPLGRGSPSNWNISVSRRPSNFSLLPRQPKYLIWALYTDLNHRKLIHAPQMLGNWSRSKSFLKMSHASFGSGKNQKHSQLSMNHFCMGECETMRPQAPVAGQKQLELDIAWHSII